MQFGKCSLENAVWKLSLLSFRSSVSAASHLYDYLPGVYHKCLMRLGRNEEQGFDAVVRISIVERS